MLTWLKANIALAANRVYPVKLPQNFTLPAITYSKVSGVRVQSHDGPSNLAYPRFQISCWGNKYLAAKQLAEEVRQDMDCYSGAMGGTTVQVSRLINEVDFHNPEVGVYQIALDFYIWHTET